MAIGAAPFVRSNEVDLLERGLRTIVFRAYDRRVGEFQQIYNMGTAEKAVVSDAVMAGTGTFRQKDETMPPEYDNGGEAYKRQYAILTYALGLKISREAREDDLYGFTPKLADDLGDSAKYTQEILAMSPLNNSSAVQYTAEGTDYPLLSATHYRLDGGTWSNILSSGADLTPETLELALNQWHTGMVDQRGQKVMIKPKYLVVGVNDRFNAQRILMSVQRAYTANNDINVLKDMDLTLVVLTHMTNDNRWYLMADKSDHTLNWLTRRPVSMDKMTEGTGSDTTLYVCSYRVASPGVTAAQGIFGSL